MSLCVITPRLPPSIDGVGDYCRQFWQYCRPNTGALSKTPWLFLVLDGVSETKRFWPEIKVETMRRSQGALIAQLEETRCETVLLQYVGYGYDKAGAPFWLVRALAEWKQRDKSRQLIVMFHETWSSGPVWQRTFWQMRRQKRCVKQLLDIASTVATSMEPNAKSLAVLDPSTPIHVIPIGSSFNTTPSQDKNWKRLLIFGKEHSRVRALKQHKRLIKGLIESRLIETIVLAGQNPEREPVLIDELVTAWSPDVEIIKAYNFSPLKVPNIVRDCGLAIMHTQSSNLLKSTAFQLAVQLGQVTISRWERPADPPLLLGEHYLAYKDNEIATLKEKLSDQGSLLQISQQCTALGDQYLNWSNLANQWSKLLTNTN